MIKQILLLCINGLRPLFGSAHCYYEVGCTEFATTQLQTKSVVPAVLSIGSRIVSCNPLSFYYSSKKMLRTLAVAACLVFAFQSNIVASMSDSTTEIFSVHNCNIELIRSESDLAKIIAQLCQRLNVQPDGRLQTTYTSEGWQCHQVIKPQAYINIAVNNRTNSVRCTIDTQKRHIRDKKDLEAWIAGLFRTAA
jgi:Putative membrane protein insertion efficiency factor